MLGFDRLDDVLNRLAKNSPDGYPPYNIEQIGDGVLRITLAVAGFSIDDLNIALEDNQPAWTQEMADKQKNETPKESPYKNAKIDIKVLNSLKESSAEYKNAVANGIVLYGYLKVLKIHLSILLFLL